MASITLNSTPVRASRKWLRYAGIGLTMVILACIGAVIALVPYANDNNSLKSALAHIERGSVPDEPADYAALMEKERAAAPPAQVIPGSYSSLDAVHDVAYNAVLNLKPDGAYDYALTVGNDRVFKLYKHTGKWWVEGRVLHTILLEGDAFLTAPAARDRKTPSREHIIESSPDAITLQAHYGPQVKFQKVN